MDPYFNPRSREGSDQTTTAQSSRIHHFNPRSREGSDFDCSAAVIQACEFQSTLPRRERQADTRACAAFRSDFNPRSREGSDKQRTGSSSTLWNFNPRSREGSDRTGGNQAVAACNFNPRSREGSDCSTRWKCRRSSDFNPRSREGSDAGSDLRHLVFIVISIHAPAKGATAILYNKFHFLCIILYILSAIT